MEWSELRYLEDFVLNETQTLGSVRVTREDILDFGRRFDPQPFHVDEEAARASPFGGLVASGWHTAALAQRLMVQGFSPRALTYGSPGVDELRFILPVRPDDVLTLHATVIESRPLRSKPDRGLLKFRSELANQRGEIVLAMVGFAFFGRKPVDSQNAR